MPGCAGWQGWGPAAQLLGLFSAHGSETISAQMGTELFRCSTRVLQLRHKSARGRGWGGHPCYFMAVFLRVIWTYHTSCATAVFTQGKIKRELKNKQNISSVGQWPSVQMNLYFTDLQHLQIIFQNHWNIYLQEIKLFGEECWSTF